MSVDRYGALGFAVAAAFAVVQRWSLPEFCWSIWLTGLLYAWVCVAAASIQIILTARSSRSAYDARLPGVARLSPAVFLLGVTVVSAGTGWVALRLYSIVFGFYGLFLSVFAEMEPHALFGRNGFINSDFFTPVTYLLLAFWPMAAAALIANWQDLFLLKNPWKRILLPAQQEIVRMHVMVLAVPFVSLLAWMLFRGAYQSITIVLLMGIFYLVPRTRPKDQIDHPQDTAAGGP